MPITPNIVIHHPPDFDGELHIQVEASSLFPGALKYTFIPNIVIHHAAKGTEWETLVAAAKAIVAQDQRKSKK